jgi:hypothetical protein
VRVRWGKRIRGKARGGEKGRKKEKEVRSGRG